MALIQLAFAAAVSAVAEDVCGDVSVVNATETCGGAGVLVDLDTVHNCSQQLCASFDFEYAIGIDSDWVLTGNSSGCQVIANNNYNASDICVDSTPEPTPVPTPVPAECAAVKYIPDVSCGADQIPADQNVIAECVADICAQFEFEFAMGNDNESIVWKKDDVCQIIPFNNQPNITSLCTDTPVTNVPTQVPETPAPEGVCEPIMLGTGAEATCDGGSIIIGMATLEECQEYLCNNLDFVYAMGADNTTVLSNSSQGCAILPRGDKIDISELCVALPTPPPPTEVPIPSGGGGSSGMSGAGIFFLVVFVLFASYLFFGVLFNHFVQGKVGMEKIPNYESWCKLKDKCMCKRKGFHAVNANGINADGLAH